MIPRFAKFSLILLVAITDPLSFAAHTDWRMITSSHFFVLTNVGEGPAREAALHLEQMRMIFGQLLSKDKIVTGEPLDVFVLRGEDYEKAVPLRDGRAVSMGGFFIPGEDRSYIVLNAEQNDGWRAVAHDYALMLLNYNYPPAQTWFDEGFAQYFAGMRMGEKEGSMGEDPEGSFVATLNSSEWIPVAQLFARKNQPAKCSQDDYEKLFCAESWMVMHYLVNNDRLSDVGAYFGAVMLHKAPIEDAIKSAFGMTPDQFEKAVKDYFHARQAEGSATASSSAGAHTLVHPVVPPIAMVGFGSTQDSVEQSRGDALLAEMMIRIPDRRDEAMKEINFLMNGDRTENSVEHRALAWLYIQEKKHDQAVEELKDAAELKPNDAWVLYYSSLLKYKEAEASGKEYQGLENMFQEMRAVIDRYPEFAEAYNMLAMARLDGGGINSATSAIRKAIDLAPRNQSYILHLAEIYMAAKKWDPAQALLEQLQAGDDPMLVKAATTNLNNLPYLRKYGILPADAAEAEKRAVYSQGSDDDEDTPDPKPTEKPKPDTRPIKFLKGTLLSVDCSATPGATLKVLAAGKRMIFKAGDYKSLVVVGADQTSCDWKNIPVAINYKALGSASGDIVSLELK
jgi:tetratricopeptide (TPR) repeat protein